MSVARAVLPCGASVRTLAPRRAAARTAHDMVESADPRAAAIGRDILRHGGNAADAAIAMAMRAHHRRAAIVRHRRRRVPGLLRRRADQHSTALDGRETAPAAARPDRFLDAGRQAAAVLSTRVVGGRSVGVPGLLRMLERGASALRQAALGASSSRRRSRSPSNGFPLSPRVHALLARRPLPAARSGGARALLPRRRHGEAGRHGHRQSGARRDAAARSPTRGADALLRRRDRARHRARGRGRQAAGRSRRERSRRLSREGAPGAVPALSRQCASAAWAAGRASRSCWRSWACSQPFDLASHTSPTPRRGISSPRRAASPMPTARAISAIPISSRRRSRACSIAHISRRARKLIDPAHAHPGLPAPGDPPGQHAELWGDERRARAALDQQHRHDRPRRQRGRR